MRIKMNAIALGVALAFGAGTALAAAPTPTPAANIQQDGANSAATITQTSNADGVTATIKQLVTTNKNTDKITQTSNAAGTMAIIVDETGTGLKPPASTGASGNKSTVTQTGSTAGAEIYTVGSKNTASIKQVNIVDDPLAEVDNAIILNGGSNNIGSIYQHDGSYLSARIVRSLNIESPSGSTPSTNDKAGITQSGYQQTATIDQTDAKDSDATIAQSGSGSIGEYDQIGYDTASVTQSGANDKSTITQVGHSTAGFYNTATVTQSGNNDTGNIHQNGYSDVGTAAQTGNNDSAIINQLAGIYQNASVTQSGNLDIANVNQFGSGGNQATVLQQGNSDLADVSQAGFYQTAFVTQSGNGDKAYITLGASYSGAPASIMQTGNNNVGRITQN